MSSSLIGQKLGNYEVVNMLGHGGMATVYMGYQATVDRKVAIKVLSPQLGLNPQFVERFQLEARTIAQLQHPHILPLYDYGKTEDLLYLVMAYIDGGTLEEIMDGPMKLGRVERVLREVAGALDYAHRQGIIHRDIKPANILLDGEGHALLADFGIAKLAEGNTNLTGTAIVGTPAYMAPEQAQGMEIDGRADIYSLGVMAFEMLTGRQPFVGDTVMQVMVKVMQEMPPDITTVVDGLPPEVGDVINQVLSKDPADRYQNATEFAEAFARAAAQGDTGTIAVPLDVPTDVTQVVGPATRTTSSKPAENENPNASTIVVQQTNPLVLLGGVGIIALAVIIAVLLIVGGGDDTDDERDLAGVGATVAASGVLQTRQAVAADGEEETPQAIETPVVVVPDVPTFGQVSFRDSDAIGDSLSISAEGMDRPPEGLTYVGWLVNTQTDDKLNIGELLLDAFGAGTLSFTDAEGRLLPANYNAFTLTAEERANADGAEPAGDIFYSGSIPVEMTDALALIFTASEIGFNGGSLLDGAETEAFIGADHAGRAVNSSNISGVYTHSEHTVNILLGEEEDYNGNGRGENPGRGVGVYAFLDAMDAALQAGIDAGDSTVGVNAQSVLTCIFNTRERTERLESLAREMLAAADMDAVGGLTADVQTVADALISGVDLNENGTVDPFEGECGLDQIPTYGALIGRMTITEGGLDAS